VVKLSAGEFSPSLTVTAAGNLSAGGTASASLVTLAGTPVVGDRWTVTLNGTPYFVPVNVGQSLADVATALAAAVNGLSDFAAAAAFADFTAIGDGSVLFIANRAGASFTTSYGVTPVAASTNSAIAKPSAILSGTPALGEAWNVTLNGTTFSHPVVTAETLATIASAL